MKNFKTFNQFINESSVKLLKIHSRILDKEYTEVKFFHRKDWQEFAIKIAKESFKNSCEIQKDRFEFRWPGQLLSFIDLLMTRHNVPESEFFLLRSVGSFNEGLTPKNVSYYHEMNQKFPNEGPFTEESNDLKKELENIFKWWPKNAYTDAYLDSSLKKEVTKVANDYIEKYKTINGNVIIQMIMMLG
jgi:hypothetical protein